MLLLDQEKFEVLLTSDKNLHHQQNLKKYAVNFVLINVKQNSYPAIKKMASQILQVLSTKLTQKIAIIGE